jgi:23S rRNA (pseudouridine1915-N3)-methyltransferase
MVISIIAVGKLKHPGLRDLCDEYTKRLRGRLRLDIIEVRAAGRREEKAAAAMRHEGDSIRRAIPKNARVFCLTRNGPSETSEAFADRLATWKTDGRDVALVVGGAFGLDDGLREEAEATLGLSPMTLPHELARAVLLEQLYRADTILRGEPYHKGRG